MSKVTKYLSETPTEPPPSKKPTECLVNGCPLPGVYRQTNETSICCVHEEEDAKDWPEQTTRIRNREPLWLLALDMTNAAPGEPVPQKAIDGIVAMGAPPPRYRDGERMTLRLYGAQIKGWLTRECKGEKEFPRVEKERFDTWRSLRNVVRAP